MTTKDERNKAIASLREMLTPGDTLYTVLRKRARSGMSRNIDVFLLDATGTPGNQLRWLSGYVSTACGVPRAKDEGLRLSGAGMDMGFWLVYNIGRALYPDGFECAGERCRSNDHSNGDRDRTPHHHKDGGYAFRQDWI